MKEITDEIKNEIAPFILIDGDTSYSVILNAGILYDDEFLNAGQEGGGYSWDAVADIFIKENFPQYEEILNHDSEADMFCIYTDNVEALLEFAVAFKDLTDDRDAFMDIFSRADFEEWD